MNINITIGVTPELEKALLGLTSLLNVKAVPSVQEVANQPVSNVVPMTNTQQPAPVQQQAPVNAVPVTQQHQQAPVPQQAPVQQQSAPTAVPTSAPEYSMDQLAQACGPLVDAGRREEITQLLGALGANPPFLMQLPKEQYGAFATRLRELGAKI